MNNSLRIYKFSDEHRANISKSKKGKPLPKETRAKMSLALLGNTRTKGYKHSEETKKKISEANKGRKLSKEHIETLRKINKGKKLTEEMKRKLLLSHLGKPLSEEVKAKISLSNKGKKLTEEQRLKRKDSHRGIKHSEETKRILSIKATGRKASEETKQKMREAHQRGKSHLWKGGVTAPAILIRNSTKNVEWRQDCMVRDKFTCQECGDNSGGNLEVHHIKPFITLVKEAVEYLPLFHPYDAAMMYNPLWDLSNGITLCKLCHLSKRGKE